MTPTLSLVLGEARATTSFRPPPYRLDARAQRPGELADLLVPELDDGVRKHVEALARTAGLPLPLMLVIAVESERALSETAGAAAFDRAELIAALDDAAARSPVAGFDPPPTRRLRAYAAALRSGGYRQPAGRLELAVPHRVSACWSVAAQEAGDALNGWLSAMAAAATPGRERWEAEAAASGRTVAEWIALQALKRARSSSSAAQATASG